MDFLKNKLPILTLLLILPLSACGTTEKVVLKKDDASTTVIEQTKFPIEEETAEQNIEKTSTEIIIDPKQEGTDNEEKSSTKIVKKEPNVEQEDEPEETSENSTTVKIVKEQTTTTAKAEPVKTQPIQKTEKPSEKLPTAEKSTSPIVKAGIPLSMALLPTNNSEQRTTPITHVVTHFTSNAANNPKNPYQVQDIRQLFIDYGVSAHYLIGRNGEIYQLVSENRVAYHAGKGNLASYPQYKDKLNAHSIGIELMAIGTEEEMSLMMDDSVYNSISPNDIGYTDAQYKSLISLLNDILERNSSIGKDRVHIVGHDEYAPGRKTDPGSLFNWALLGL